MRDLTQQQVWPVDSSSFDHVIFEGAQGLRLDEFGEDFPYVTRSRTGLTNVIEMLDATTWTRSPDVYYVTRPYLTRHGAGPLKNELPKAPYDAITDETNIPNMHQGSLRYAWLDLDVLASNIAKDLAQKDPRDVRARLALTCLDQVPTLFTVVANGEEREITADRMVAMLEERLDLAGDVRFYSDSNRRETRCQSVA